MALSPEQIERNMAVLEAERVIDRHKKFKWLTYIPQLQTQELKDAIPYATSLIVGSASLMILSAIFQDVQILFFNKIAQNTDILTRVKDPAMGLAGIGGIIVGDLFYKTIWRKQV
jgi:hypothetical protein